MNERGGRRVGYEAVTRNRLNALLALFVSITLLGALCAFVLATQQAHAATSDEFLVQVCGNGAGAGECNNVRGIATDPATGHVFVASSSPNNRIEEFTSWGRFVKAWGWGVRDGARELQTCTILTDCQPGLAGAGAGQFGQSSGGPNGVAVDSAGDVYVADNAFNRQRVQKFSPGGAFELMFGGGVVAGGAVGTGNVTAGSTTVSSLKATDKAFVVGQTVSGANIPAGTTVTAVTTGAAATLTLSKAATATASGETLSVTEGTGNVPTNERQTVTLGANTTGGTFTLTVPARQGFAAATTAGIAWNASAAQVQAALEALATIDPGDVLVTSANPGGGTERGGPYTVEFTGRLADTDVAQLTASATGLTISSGTKSVTVATTQVGASAGEVCTVAAQCQSANNGNGPGQFGNWRTGAFVAVDGSDRVYVGDSGRIERFSAAGAWEADLGTGILGTGGFVEALALDPAGNIYAVSQNVANTVRKLDPTGATLLGTISVPQPQALAVDAESDLYVAGGSSEPGVYLYDESGAKLPGEFAKGDFSASRAIAVGLLGDGTPTPGDLYVGNSVSNNGYVRAYGPIPQFDPPPPVPPEISDQHAAAVSSDAATVEASIDPHFWDTEYFVEYGTEECSIGSCAQAPVPAADLSGEARGANPVAIELAGLAPGNLYHYRFVAISHCDAADPAAECRTEGNELTFRTPREGTVGSCPNDSLRTGAGSRLPDCRAYEMVSPPQKNSAEIAAPNPAGLDFGQSFSVIPVQASGTGEGLAYATATSFGEAESSPLYSEYLARRTASGWATENVNPKFEEGYLRDPFVGFSSDLAKAAVIAIEPPLTADATAGFPNLYSRDNADGTLTAITTEVDRPTVDPGNSSRYCVSFQGASADYSRVFFAAMGALLPGDPTAPDGFNLYEWSAARPVGDRLRLVSVLPSGDPAVPTSQTSLGNGELLVTCDMRLFLLRHAVSEDGSRAFWMSKEPFFETSPGVFANKPLLARVDGSETVQLDAVQGGSAFFGGQGKYWDASVDGSRVFFTDELALTPGANGTDLYRYDFGRPAGEELENLTAHSPESANVQGVIGVSADGARAYFVAKGVLDPAPNRHGESAASGENNLYLWDGGTIRFVSRFAASGDQAAWAIKPTEQTSRISPDGRHLVFVSSRSLTGYDNQSEPEVYRYASDDDELLCISCNPSGARPEGPSGTGGWSTPYQPPRNLAVDGGRVFFESGDSLVPADTNGKWDVYQWEAAGSGGCTLESASYSEVAGGCIDPISSGQGESDSTFLDASASGDDVFIATRDPLAPQDGDERYDAYDARVGGGFAFARPAGCEAGEGCRGPVTGSGAGTAAGSAAFVGPGDPWLRRPCPKGKRRVKRHGKVRCVRRHHRHGNRHKKHGKKPGNVNRRAGK